MCVRRVFSLGGRRRTDTFTTAVVCSKPGSSLVGEATEGKKASLSSFRARRAISSAERVSGKCVYRLRTFNSLNPSNNLTKEVHSYCTYLTGKLRTKGIKCHEAS